jgi:hypothetical protein
VRGNPLRYVDPTGHTEACPDNNCGSGSWTPPQQPPTNDANDPLAAYRRQQPPPEKRVFGLTSNDWSLVTLGLDTGSFMVAAAGDLVSTSLGAFGLVDPPAGVTAEAFVAGMWFGFFKPLSNVLTGASIVSTLLSGVASGENTMNVRDGSLRVSVSQDLLADLASSTVQARMLSPSATSLVAGAAVFYDIGRIDMTKLDLGPVAARVGRSTLIPTVINPSLQIGPGRISFNLWSTK